MARILPMQRLTMQIIMKPPQKVRCFLVAVLSFLVVLCGTTVRAQDGYDAPPKTDVFNAGPQGYNVDRKKAETTSARRTTAREKPASKTKKNKGPTARLRRGEILEVFRSSTSARPEMAFYLPPEATSIVQLVVERHGSKMSYFLKAFGTGNTVGGAVERRWLDKQGFRPRNAADEARIQAEVRRNPLFIEVR